MKENRLIIVILVLIIILAGLVGVVTFMNSQNSDVPLFVNNSTNITNDTNVSGVIVNSSDDNLCPICGKPLVPGESYHTDGTTHSDEEIYKWGVKTGRITPDSKDNDGVKDYYAYDNIPNSEEADEIVKNYDPNKDGWGYDPYSN